MQLVPSKIWTRVAVSISYDDNHYTTGTSTETVLSPWLAADEDRVSHVLSHFVWWKKIQTIQFTFYSHTVKFQGYF